MTFIYLDFSGHVMVGFNFSCCCFCFIKRELSPKRAQRFALHPKLLLRVNYMLFQNCMLLAETKDFVRSSPANSLQKIPNVVAESPFECQLWMIKPSK
jgi:hypothetical protein